MVRRTFHALDSSEMSSTLANNFVNMALFSSNWLPVPRLAALKPRDRGVLITEMEFDLDLALSKLPARDLVLLSG